MATPLTVVIFGASGDLTARKLVPALYNLALKERLPEGTRILGVARTEHTDITFRDSLGLRVRDVFKATGEAWDEAVWLKFASHIHYVPADVTKPDGMAPVQKWFTEIEGATGGRRLYYMSISPELYPQVSAALGEAGFNQELGGFK